LQTCDVTGSVENEDPADEEAMSSSDPDRPHDMGTEITALVN